MASKKKQPLSYMDTFDVKTREKAVFEQKRKLIENIGKAQAILLLQETPDSEKRTRLMNPSKPAGRGNPEFTYLEHAYVSETLNWATMLNWDLIVTHQERVEDQAIVHGYLEVRFPTMTIKKHASGGMRYRANNPNMTWADAFNGATSRMLKVAAARLGIGLDLYRTEEQSLEELPEPQPQAIKPGLDDNDPATAAQLQAMKSLGLRIPENLTFKQARDLIQQQTLAGRK